MSGARWIEEYPLDHLLVRRQRTPVMAGIELYGRSVAVLVEPWAADDATETMERAERHCATLFLHGAWAICPPAAADRMLAFRSCLGMAARRHWARRGVEQCEAAYVPALPGWAESGEIAEQARWMVERNRPVLVEGTGGER